MHFRIDFCCFFGSLAGWLAGWLAGLGWLAGWAGWLAGLSAKPWRLQCSRAFGLEAARHPGASQTRFWHGRYCTNRLFMEIVFNAFGDWFLLFCESFGSYFIDYWFEISMFEASQTRFWHGRYCKNQFLMEIVFNAVWDLFLLFFQKPWELVLSTTDSKFRPSGLPKRGSGMESIAKIDF